MKKILMILPLFFFLIACESKNEEVKVENTSQGTHKIEVVNFMNASNYTYIEVKESDETYWIAVPQMEVKQGEVLYFSKSMVMNDFESPSLNRRFDKILFVEDISRTPENPHMTMGHPEVRSSKEDIKVEKLKDGITVEKIYSSKESLAGKKIKLRGKVTKYNEGILDRNWIHVQDGTGYNGNFDLVLTSNESVKVGEIIKAEGTVVLNKDFGSGYTYEVLIENTDIEVE